MIKQKFYYKTKFPLEVIKQIYDSFLTKLDDNSKPCILAIENGNETWRFDTVDEFFSEYPRATGFQLSHSSNNCQLYLHLNGFTMFASIEFPIRSDIESIFQLLEANLDKSKITITSEPITVFIGHGNDNQWRHLKDHLHEQHGFNVEAYEIGPRAGSTVKEVLELMLDKSSFALLILTGEDMDTYGQMHARENVIHELGLFQGKLGFKKAIVLLEKDTAEFSNILGITQIRFAKGNIRETFGDVLATIRREFNGED